MKRNTPYTPRGNLPKLIAALKAEPTREFTSQEAADILGIRQTSVWAYTEYARKRGVLYRKTLGGRMLLRATPFDPVSVKLEDVWAARTPKVVPGWKPPSMQHVRGGA